MSEGSSRPPESYTRPVVGDQLCVAVYTSPATAAIPPASRNR